MSTHANPQLQSWLGTLAQARVDVNRIAATVTHSGRLTRAVGLVLEAVGLQLPVGSDCLIELPPGYPQRHAEAEVVGFAGDRLFLMPQSEVAGLIPGARVLARPGSAKAGDEAHGKRLPVGEGMLGRVVDAVGRPLDGLGPLDIARKVPLSTPPINPSPARPSTRCSTPACAPSTPCSPSAAASAWACSPAPAWARACCSG